MTKEHCQIYTNKKDGEIIFLYMESIIALYLLYILCYIKLIISEIETHIILLLIKSISFMMQ